jgi:hypothetical protein
MKSEFENKLKELGYSYQYNTDGKYIISQNNDSKFILTIHLICSNPVDFVILGSRNGNEIKGIGLFKLGLPLMVKGQDYHILAFRDTKHHSIEFIIISSKELIRRLVDCSRISNDKEEVEIVFWLMPDDHLFQTTSIGAEAEWYYLSKGLNGRLADGSTWDYSSYLNDWGRLRKL